MRAIHYAVFNKETNERIYRNISYSECLKKLNSLENKDKFEIRHKWFSF